MSHPYQLEIQPASEFAQLSADPQVFAIIRHGECSRLLPGTPFVLDLGLKPLGEAHLEVWRSNEVLTTGSFKQVHYTYSDTFLFGCMLLDEADYADLSTATLSAYEQIHDALEDVGFPALTRMWNFFPAINVETEGLERYRAFCSGRHKALDDWHFTEDLLPAASAIGSHGNGLVIYFFAARQAGLQIENPRQVSAFRYPKQYGLKSPSFSRATYKNWGNCQHLYISGTASIVGHKTVHEGDVSAQLSETLRNIRVLIEQAHSLHDVDCCDIGDLNSLRVYVRHPEHAALIAKRLHAELGDGRCQLVLVQGDICRADLLLEIEGHYTA